MASGEDLDLSGDFSCANATVRGRLNVPAGSGSPVVTNSTLTGNGQTATPLAVATDPLLLGGSTSTRLILKRTVAGQNASNLRWRNSVDATLYSMGPDFAGGAEQSFFIFDNVSGDTLLFNATAGPAAGGFLSFGATQGGFQYDDATQEIEFFANGNVVSTMFGNGSWQIANRLTVTEGAEFAQLIAGTGDPEGVIASHVGSLYMRLDGGANTTLYVKEGGGAGNTGWVAK